MPQTPLTPERWRKTQEILLAVWDGAPDQRDRLLELRCAGDPELLAELRGLVAADEAASAWQAPPVEPGLAAPYCTEGRRAGPFELERLIGRGGMGAVYLAHRADGQFEQKVAVKLIGLPFEIETFRERFRRERQILAGLNHPNITRLLDGGVTSDGELYLAMEYVDGVWIEQYSRQPGRSTGDRLRLFRDVCSAVQYAHQNLIIHRDIKPSNILVTADGTAKLLDFGTAKLMAEADMTQTGLQMMTTAYASPEQLRGEPVSTLSDVYSLGVVLFEMLTGERLFTGNTAARLTGESPAGLCKVSGGELRQTLGKALAAEPGQRYSSVEQFSEDIRRYLEGEPVLAHPPSLFYRSTKFIGRHRFGVAGAVLLLMTIAAGVGATRQAELRAERRFDEVRQLANYLVFDIHDGLQRLPGSTALEKQVVERSLEYLDRLAKESSTDQPLRLELAAAYQKLGDVLGNPFQPSLGDRTAALAVYPKALELARGVVARDPHNLRARQLAAAIKLQYGGTQFFGGDREAGKAQLGQAVEELKSLLAESPDDLETRLEIARGLTFQAGRMQDGGGFTTETDPGAIEKVYDQALAHLAYALKQHPNNVQALRQMAQNEVISGLLWGSQNPAKSMLHEEEALRALDRIPSELQNDVELRRLRARGLQNIGWAQGQLHRYDAALENTGKATGLFQALAAADPSDASALYQLSGSYRNRGILRGYAKDIRGAIQDFESAAEIHRQLSERDPANSNYRTLRGELLLRIGSLFQSLGERGAAVSKTSEGLEIVKRLAAATKASPSQLMSACGWMVETAVVSLRDAKGAMPYCQRAVDLTGGKDLEAWLRLAMAKHEVGERKEAVAMMEKAIGMLPAAEPGKPRSRQRESMEANLADWRRGK